MARQVLTVVAAVIRRRGRILVTRRRHDDTYGGWWEFPGGKPERGETLKVAIAREVLEETGLPVRVGRRLRIHRYAYPERTVVLHFFECHVLAPSPRRGEGRVRGFRARALDTGAVKWVKPSDFGRYRFLPADGPLLEDLAAAQ